MLTYQTKVTPFTQHICFHKTVAALHKHHLTDINFWLTLVCQFILQKEPLVKISHIMNTKTDIWVFMLTNFCSTWIQLNTLKITEMYSIISQNTSLDTALWSSRLWQHVGWYKGSSVSDETAPFTSRLWWHVGWYIGSGVSDETAPFTSRLWQHVGWYIGSGVSDETAPFTSRLWQHAGWYICSSVSDETAPFTYRLWRHVGWYIVFQRF